MRIGDGTGLCPHGRMIRSCQMCDADKEISRLKAALAEAEKDIQTLKSQLDNDGEYIIVLHSRVAEAEKRAEKSDMLGYERGFQDAEAMYREKADNWDCAMVQTKYCEDCKAPLLEEEVRRYREDAEKWRKFVEDAMELIELVYQETDGEPVELKSGDILRRKK